MRLRSYRNYVNVLVDDEDAGYRDDMRAAARPRAPIRFGYGSQGIKRGSESVGGSEGRGGAAEGGGREEAKEEIEGLFHFSRNIRSCDVKVSHFQLRNLVWATRWEFGPPGGSLV